MIIEKDLPCFLSEKGYYNFIYPTDERAILREGCAAERLSWMSGDNRMIALRVPRMCVLPINISGSSTNHINPPIQEETTIVWISR